MRISRCKYYSELILKHFNAALWVGHLTSFRTISVISDYKVVIECNPSHAPDEQKPFRITSTVPKNDDSISPEGIERFLRGLRARG